MQVAGLGSPPGGHGAGVRLERAGLDVVGLLADRGIDSVALKGMALANTVYADPGWRSFGDVDVLVDPAQFVAGIDALVAPAHGATIRRCVGVDPRFAKDVPVLLDSMTIDLHRTLIQGPFGERIPVRRLLAASRAVELGGSTLRVLTRATPTCSRR